MDPKITISGLSIKHTKYAPQIREEVIKHIEENPDVAGAKLELGESVSSCCKLRQFQVQST